MAGCCCAPAAGCPGAQVRGQPMWPVHALPKMRLEATLSLSRQFLPPGRFGCQAIEARHGCGELQTPAKTQDGWFVLRETDFNHRVPHVGINYQLTCKSLKCILWSISPMALRKFHTKQAPENCESLLPRYHSDLVSSSSRLKSRSQSTPCARVSYASFPSV